MTVRCCCCHRVEDWSDDTVTVRVPGGGRRPALHPARTAWDGFLQGREAGEAVVGRCAACDMPLLSADPEAVGQPYRIALPGGALTVGPEIVGPTGALSVADAEQWLAEQVPPPSRNDPATLAFSGIALGGMSLLAFGFALALYLAVWFVIWGPQHGALMAR